MSESILKDKSYAFAIRIVEVSRFLSSEKRRICSEQTTPPIRDRCRGGWWGEVILVQAKKRRNFATTPPPPPGHSGWGLPAGGDFCMPGQHLLPPTAVP